ncbi:Peptidyl-tRNA hydrolase [bioreactor metagenome]|uniref:peptidyl-tRNA hydrolase n=1 Tax=bioreactor metagenome TaxID=1076179 RepID=A0A644TPW8_9ZZZZ|nr:aminoacyl-tRNA hydrolase [Negativicutes bacterium]
MKIVVGLGNPGTEYSETRHNAGFMVIDELARRWKLGNWRSKHQALIAEYRGAEEQVLLVKPQTYMNLSGTAVGELARWYKVAVEDVIVAYDDMDLSPGKLRIRIKGGSGGHRGMESLLVHLGQDSFIRVRVGIGRPPEGWEVVSHVLARFTADEVPLVEQAVKKAAEAIESMIADGVNKAMNKYNK